MWLDSMKELKTQPRKPRKICRSALGKGDSADGMLGMPKPLSMLAPQSLIWS